MNEQPPIIDSEPMSRREARRQRREQRLADPSRAGTWTVGLILIALGGLFLLSNMGWDVPLSNWWALFILIPAIGAFTTAGRMYHEAGNRLTREIWHFSRERGHPEVFWVLEGIQQVEG